MLDKSCLFFEVSSYTCVCVKVNETASNGHYIHILKQIAKRCYKQKLHRYIQQNFFTAVSYHVINIPLIPSKQTQQKFQNSPECRSFMYLFRFFSPVILVPWRFDFFWALESASSVSTPSSFLIVLFVLVFFVPYNCFGFIWPHASLESCYFWYHLRAVSFSVL